MADEGEDAADRGTNNITELNGTIQHILLDYGVKGKMDIVEIIARDIDVETIVQTRESVFQIASAQFYEKHCSPDMVVELQLKARRGGNAILNYAKDVYDLYGYIQEDLATFPKDVLKNPGALVEIRESETENVSTNTNSVPTQVIEPDIFEDVQDEVIKAKFLYLSNICSEQRDLIVQLEKKIKSERMQREREMELWTGKLHVLIDELRKKDYVSIEECGDSVNVVFKPNVKHAVRDQSSDAVINSNPRKTNASGNARTTTSTTESNASRVSPKQAAAEVQSNVSAKVMQQRVSISSTDSSSASSEGSPVANEKASCVDVLSNGE